MPPAENQLLRLDEELDLADAAATQLEVVAGDGDPPPAAKSVDLPLHRMNVGDGGEVEILAPDERRQLRKNASPASVSPATERALISAARSQFWPTLLVVGQAGVTDSAIGVEAGSGRSRRSMRKT